MKKFKAMTLVEIIASFTIIAIVASLAVGMSRSRTKYIEKYQLYTTYTMLKDIGSTLANIGYTDKSSGTDVTINRLPFYLYSNTSSYTSTYTRGSLSFTPSGTAPTATEDFTKNSLITVLSDTLNAAPNGIDGTKTANDNDTTFTNKTPTVQLGNGVALYFVAPSTDPKHDLNLRMAIKDYKNNIIPKLKTYNGTSNFNTYAASCTDNLTALTGTTYKNASFETISEAYKIINEIQTLRGITLTTPESIANTNPDYYTIFADINGPEKGQNKENQDVIKFRLYRTGHVLPESTKLRDQTEYLSAKIYQKNVNGVKKSYLYSGALKPLNEALCRAGDYPTYPDDGIYKYFNKHIYSTTSSNNSYCNRGSKDYPIHADCKNSNCFIELVKQNLRI